MVSYCEMNIIDTGSNINPRKDQKSSIKNIPLFQIKGAEYLLKTKNYTNIIFQSIPSVKFFNDYEFLKNNNITIITKRKFYHFKRQKYKRKAYNEITQKQA